METTKLDAKLLLFGIAIINLSGLSYVHDAIRNAASNGVSPPEIGLVVGFVVSLIGLTYGEGTGDTTPE